jgi:hypothetical protein
MSDEKQPAKDSWTRLYETAIGQIDEIRDAIVRGSHAGKAKLDAQLLKRQKDRLLAELGAHVLEEAERGAALPPGTEELAQKIRDVDAQIQEAEAEAKKAFR